MAFKPYGNPEEVIADLNKHFKTVALERYPRAMLNICLEKAFLKEFKNKDVSKISDNARKRLMEYILTELHTYYGEWVNLYNFDRKLRAYTNFEVTYKTEFGRLYGSMPGTYLDHLFYTAHCFEQFKERYNEENFRYLRISFQKTLFTNPNPADYLRILTMNSFYFCETDKFIYLDLIYGVLVVEKITNNLFIAKTYLTPEMDYPREGWAFTYMPAVILSPGLRDQAWEEEPPELSPGHIITEGAPQMPFEVCHELIKNLKSHPVLGY
jgi:hypothetical protein